VSCCSIATFFLSLPVNTLQVIKNNPKRKIYQKRYANFKEKQRKKQAARLKVQLFSRVIYMRARARP
jgi:hypothetical protein